MIKGFVNAENFSQIINNVLNQEEQFFVFESGNSAKSLGGKRVVDLNTFNFFSLYDSNVFKSFNTVKEMLNQICLELNVNAKSSQFYISSQYFNGNVDQSLLYDFGGLKIPCFSGIISLQKKDFAIYFNDGQVNISFGDALIFEAGKEVRFDTADLECIYFYIAPLFMLERQYPQKWIPIGD